MELSLLALAGVAVLAGLYAGKISRKTGLPSMVGYLIMGAVMGVSILGLFDVDVLERLAFIPNLALGFVAFSIGSELHLGTLRKMGKSILLILLFETGITFVLVTLLVLLVTGDWPMALIFGAMAPATAPAGTVAVIQDYRARGELTQTLYAVVGFDDGIAIMIFGFASAISKSMLGAESGVSTSFLRTAGGPVLEILASAAVGLALGFVYTWLVRRLRSNDNIPALTFGFICFSVGLAISLDLSSILTPMMMGFVLCNTSRKTTGIVSSRLRPLMPLIFILFFFLAGAHLDLGALPALGVLGLVYIVGRSSGKLLGAGLGAMLGGAPPKIRKYLGLGILSQAGVAIGLSIVVAQQFSLLGAHGEAIGAAVITTVTATCVIFEIIGPVMAKIALRRAGEIPDQTT